MILLPSDTRYQRGIIDELRHEIERGLRQQLQPKAGVVFLSEGCRQTKVYTPDRDELSGEIYDSIPSGAVAVFSIRPRVTQDNFEILSSFSQVYFCGPHPLQFVSDHLPENFGQLNMRRFPLRPNQDSQYFFINSYWGMSASETEMAQDEKYMQEAIDFASVALDKRKPIVGAVIVKCGEIIGRGTRMRVSQAYKHVTMHAERAAMADVIRDRPEAIEDLLVRDTLTEDSRLIGSTLYTTLEPCMDSGAEVTPCAGLILKSGIKEVVFGLQDDFHYRGQAIAHLREHGLSVRPAWLTPGLLKSLENLKGNPGTLRNDPRTETVRLAY